MISRMDGYRTMPKSVVSRIGTSWICCSTICLSLAVSGCNQTPPETLSSRESGFTVAEEGQKPASEGQSPQATADGQELTGVTRLDSASGSVPQNTTEVASQNAIPGPSLPSAGVNPSLLSVQDLSERSFMRLAAPAGNDPAELLKFFADTDQAIQDLVTAANKQQIDEKQFTETAKRLCSQKRSVGETLATSTAASPDQKKAGMIAQLESLSHLTGLKDVEAAKQLEALAAQLSQGPDAELAHQGRLVKFGFRLNALQEGLEKDPNSLVSDIDGLFARPEDRGYPEFMALQQSAMVLQSMGFADAAKAVADKLAKEYRESADPELSMMAWSIDTNGSPALLKYSTELRNVLQGQSPDGQALVAAATSLFEAFPSANTLGQMASQVVNLEYSGNLATCQMLVGFLKSKLDQFSASPISKQVLNILNDHEKRVALIGQPLDLSGLSTFDGQPFDWSQYRGKVVLVDFWATWCMPCLKEIPNVRKAHDELSGQGFEVVSINLDDKNPEATADFVMKNRFPWQTVRSSDPQAIGFETPAAARIGISAIPFVILVDKEGKVAGLHVRGEKIVPAVRSLLASQAAQ